MGQATSLGFSLVALLKADVVQTTPLFSYERAWDHSVQDRERDVSAATQENEERNRLRVLVTGQVRTHRAGPTPEDCCLDRQDAGAGSPYPAGLGSDWSGFGWSRAAGGFI